MNKKLTAHYCGPANYIPIVQLLLQFFLVAFLKVLLLVCFHFVYFFTVNKQAANVHWLHIIQKLKMFSL